MELVSVLIIKWCGLIECFEYQYSRHPNIEHCETQKIKIVEPNKTYVCFEKLMSKPPVKESK